MLKHGRGALGLLLGPTESPTDAATAIAAAAAARPDGTADAHDTRRPRVPNNLRIKAKHNTEEEI